MLTHLCDFALDVGEPESDDQKRDAKHSPRNRTVARDDYQRRACEEYEHSEAASNVGLAVIHQSRAEEVASDCVCLCVLTIQRAIYSNTSGIRSTADATMRLVHIFSGTKNTTSPNGEFAAMPATLPPRSKFDSQRKAPVSASNAYNELSRKPVLTYTMSPDTTGDDHL